MFQIARRVSAALDRNTVVVVIVGLPVSSPEPYSNVGCGSRVSDEIRPHRDVYPMTAPRPLLTDRRIPMPIDVQPAVSPHLVVDDAAAAIDFYVKAFGATEIGRVPRPDGS